MDIDELTGRELDVAVAIELGFINYQDDFGWWWGYEEKLTELPRYSTNLNAAWELDGDGWEWWSNTQPQLDSLDVNARPHPSGYSYKARVKLSDFPTKAEAYATARCRAWLKARRAIKE